MWSTSTWTSRCSSSLSQCPRFLAHRVFLVLLFLSRSQRNSWWKCRQSCLPRASPFGSAEQIVDTPVPRGRGEGRVQGFLPRQSSTATPSVESISERTVEQNVDTSPGVGLGQGASSSAGPADEEFTGFFRTFTYGKKCGVPGRW